VNDDDLLHAFETATIPSTAFHHRDHLRVAWLYIRRDGPERGTDAMRAALVRFAAAHGVPHAYHETLTRFWTRLVAHLVEHDPAVDDFEPDLVPFPAGV
jgi:N-formylglutamate deformylase